MANPEVSWEGRVKLCRRWADEWQTLPGIYPIRCLRGCAPIEQSADLIYDFGSIKRETATTFATEIPRDLRDWYVLIELFNKADPEDSKEHWHGIIPKSTILRRGGVTAVDTGRQTFQAVGLEHVLDREFIFNMLALQDGATVRCEHMHPFNKRYKKGHSVYGNRSKNPGPDGVYVFSEQDDAKAWNNRQIIDYLFEYWAPEGPEWVLTGQIDALETIEEVHRVSNTEPQSLWQWLNRLIDRRRGLSFVLEPQPDSLTVNIRVFTLTESAISVGPKTLPPNGNQLPFTMPSIFPGWHLVDPIEFTKTTAAVFDWIEVRGERLLGCTTVAYEDSRLKIASTPDERTEYFDAGEAGRTQDRFDGTYNRFVFDPNWTYNVGQILEESSGDSLLLDCDDDGNVTAGGAQAWHDATILERTLPFKKNTDYTKHPPELLYDEKDRPEFQPIMVFVKLPEDVDGGGQYRLVDRLGDTDTGLPGCNVRTLDTRAGFELGCSPRHLFAAEDWPKGPDGEFEDVEQPPRIDYKMLAATVAFRTDQRLKIIRKIDPSVAHEAVRTLYITVPGAEYWYATRATVVDVGGGDLKRIHEGNRVLRDDSDVLRGIAAFAEAWYAKERQSVKIPIKQLDNWVALGALLTNIAGQYNEQVNTVVSSVETDFQTKVIEYQTGWGNFDLVGAMLDERKGMASRGANEFGYFDA